MLLATVRLEHGQGKLVRFPAQVLKGIAKARAGGVVHHDRPAARSERLGPKGVRELWIRREGDPDVREFLFEVVQIHARTVAQNEREEGLARVNVQPYMQSPASIPADAPHGCTRRSPELSVEVAPRLPRVESTHPPWWQLPETIADMRGAKANVASPSSRLLSLPDA